MKKKIKYNIIISKIYKYLQIATFMLRLMKYISCLFYVEVLVATVFLYYTCPGHVYFYFIY